THHSLVRKPFKCAFAEGFCQSGLLRLFLNRRIDAIREKPAGRIYCPNLIAETPLNAPQSHHGTRWHTGARAAAVFSPKSERFPGD
ncbi:MAG TPA: hypothetical protein VIY90_12620, partial [Steroidobacteraceae bacterium]